VLSLVVITSCFTLVKKSLEFMFSLIILLFFSWPVRSNMACSVEEVQDSTGKTLDGKNGPDHEYRI
jgi:hypothetical protein